MVDSTNRQSSEESIILAMKQTILKGKSISGKDSPWNSATSKELLRKELTNLEFVIIYGSWVRCSHKFLRCFSSAFIVIWLKGQMFQIFLKRHVGHGEVILRQGS